MGRPCGSGLETTQYFQKIVLRVRRKSVSSCVDADTGSTRNIIVESHVRGFRLVELHVPVAVWWNLFAELLSETHLGESRSVRWKGPGGESSCTWRTRDETSLPSFRFCMKSVFFRMTRFFYYFLIFWSNKSSL